MVAMFVHLLLSANYEDGKWRGQVVKRGQVITTRASLSRATGMSEKAVRTCLAHLAASECVKIETRAKQYTVITICKYDNYQISKPQDGQRAANERPTSGQQRASIKEEKESKNIICVSEGARTYTREELLAATVDNDLWLERAAMNIGTDTATAAAVAVNVITAWDLTGETDQSARHLLNAMRVANKSAERDKRDASRRMTAQEIKQQARNERQAAMIARTMKYAKS